MAMLPRAALVELHQSLLKLERQEEEQRQEQLSKDCEPMLELVVDSTKEQLDVYIMSVRHRSHEQLPKHCIEQGSRVVVSPSLGVIIDFECVASSFAVVSKVTSHTLTLTFAYDPPLSSGQMVNVMLNEISQHTQLEDAMSWVKNIDTTSSTHPAAPVVRILFNEDERPVRGQGPGNDVDTVSLQPRFINQNLDASQRQAVGLALRDRPLTVIHGPPGTGKTTTIVEVILQHVERGQRVLVCAPSNKAVDNLLEGLWKQTRKAHCSLRMAEVTRLGHLARMEVLHRRFSHTVKLKRRLKRKNGKETREQVQERKAALADLLRETSVLMSTLTSVRSVDLEHYFDLLVIDECGQATEPACWLAIPLAKRVLLAGDPHQLPPTILSQEAASGGLAVSLMERQMGLHGDGVVHMLDTQYRMHALIQEWSSKTLYGSKLKASKKVASRQLTDLPGVSSTPRTQQTLLLVDSAGCGLREAQDVNTSSHSNTGEAELVVCHARSLISAGLQAEDIGVITPYKQQVKLISARLRTAGLNVEVNSVDGYQGREKEAILLSLVRSNARGQVGFVGDRRRLNVAVTRARRHLFVVCNTSTVWQNNTIRSFLEHMDRSGETRSAYCERCPGGKKGRETSAASSPLPSVLAAPRQPRSVGSRQPTSVGSGQPKSAGSMLKPRPLEGKRVDEASVARLTESVGSMTLRYRRTELVRHSNQSPLPAAFGSSATASAVRDSASVARGSKSVTHGSEPVMRGLDSATRGSDVSARVGRGSVSVTRGSALSVSATRGSAYVTRGSDASGPAICRCSECAATGRPSAVRVSDAPGRDYPREPVGTSTDLPWFCHIL